LKRLDKRQIVGWMAVGFSTIVTCFWAFWGIIENTVLCTDCALSEGVIRVRDDLAVEVKRDRLLIGRGNSEVEVFAGEVRHLVDALVEGAARMVDQQMPSQ